jgi:hypothetical protein
MSTASKPQPSRHASGWFARLWAIGLNNANALRRARMVVPPLFGLYSLWLGADANWDLYNYHMYNPFAWLHGKLLLDMAPAGMQSYFNPLLDSLFYLANTHLPSRVVGFCLGALHGLSFVFILSIAQSILSSLPDEDRYRVPLLLALAGCLTANFLSGLGNSMGDDTTALFSLAALALLLSNWERLGVWTGRAVAVCVGAGVLVGFGVGLKLTNAVYAVAMCAALLFYPARGIVRLRIAFLFGVGVLVGFAATGSYWLFHMWKTFGNPLHPQFGAYFPTPFAQPDVMGDPRWRPHGWLETLLWPFIFTANSHRVGETPIRQIIWPIAYVLFWVWLGVSGMRWVMHRRREEASPTAIEPRASFVVAFVALGYFVWMEGFSIYRYIVVAEVLVPLVVWLLVQQLLPYRPARKLASWLLVIASAVVVTGGARTWGHEGWSDPLWHAELPSIAEPQRTTVVLSSTRAFSWTWLATLFPDEIAFMQVDSSFPGTPAFYDRMREVARQRGGPIYAIVDGEYNWRIDNVAGANRLVDSIGLTGGESGCNALRWAVTRLHLHASVVPATSAGKHCQLDLRADDVKDVAAENAASVARAIPIFERNGFILDPSTCTSYRSGIGKGVLIYQWCRVSLRDGR